MNDEPKFCKDCKHYSPSGSNEYWTWTQSCTHPEFRSLVTGISNYSPDTARSPLETRCGTAGKLWEKRAPEPDAPPNPVCLVQHLEPYRNTANTAWWEFWK